MQAGWVDALAPFYADAGLDASKAGSGPARAPFDAAGGIGDGRDIAAAFLLGAGAAQMGAAYLLTPEADDRRCIM